MKVVGVENAGGRAYGKATGLYNKHRKYSPEWNPWHQFWSAHDFQQAESMSQHIQTSINHHLSHSLDNFNIESSQSEDALPKLLSGLDFRHSDDS
jgi:hypothetical protein